MINTNCSVGPDDLSSVLTFLRTLSTEKYFGRVELSFQSGNIVNIRQERTLKPQDLPTLVATRKGNHNGDQSH